MGSDDMVQYAHHAVWYATGNNLRTKGDLVRRSIPIRLQSPQENPETRSDFRNADLIRYVAQNRGRLVASSLTILAAYSRVGRPRDGGLPSMDYVAWSDLVRQAVRWSSGLDPCVGQAELRTLDPERNAQAAIIAGWAELPGCLANEGAAPDGMSVSQALEALKGADGSRYGALRDALDAEFGGLPSPKRLGKKLAEMRGRNHGGQAMTARSHKSGNLWYVTPSGA